MRSILIPAIAAALILTWLSTSATGDSLDTPLIRADDSEKKMDQEKGEDKATSDEEPECD